MVNINVSPDIRADRMGERIVDGQYKRIALFTDPTLRAVQLWAGSLKKRVTVVWVRLVYFVIPHFDISDQEHFKLGFLISDFAAQQHC